MTTYQQFQDATDQRLLVAVEDGVGRVTFNQPTRRNAISLSMWQGLGDALLAFAEDDAVRVVVLAGAGSAAFSAGADISEFEKNRSKPADIEHYNAITSRANNALRDIAKPTIAAISGYCIGGGCGIAVACDMRLSSDTGRFAIPAARLGLAYRWNEIESLTQLVGDAYAKEILFTARQFNAAEAHAMGLVNRVVSPALLSALVDDYAKRIAGNAPLTVRAAKATIAEVQKDATRWDPNKVDTLVDACFGSDDYAEGRRAFAEKRAPQFKGR